MSRAAATAHIVGWAEAAAACCLCQLLRGLAMPGEPFQSNFSSTPVVLLIGLDVCLEELPTRRVLACKTGSLFPRMVFELSGLTAPWRNMVKWHLLSITATWRTSALTTFLHITHGLQSVKSGLHGFSAWSRPGAMDAELESTSINGGGSPAELESVSSAAAWKQRQQRATRDPINGKTRDKQLAQVRSS